MNATRGTALFTPLSPGSARGEGQEGGRGAAAARLPIPAVQAERLVQRRDRLLVVGPVDDELHVDLPERLRDAVHVDPVLGERLGRRGRARPGTAMFVPMTQTTAAGIVVTCS